MNRLNKIFIVIIIFLIIALAIVYTACIKEKSTMINNASLSWKSNIKKYELLNELQKYRGY